MKLVDVFAVGVTFVSTALLLALGINAWYRTQIDTTYASKLERVMSIEGCNVYWFSEGKHAGYATVCSHEKGPKIVGLPMYYNPRVGGNAGKKPSGPWFKREAE